MHYRINHRTQTQSSNLSTLASLSALLLAALAVGGCDLIDGVGGGGDAFSFDGDVTAEKVLCTPKYPERPKDCRVGESLTIRKVDDFKKLCNTKCKRLYDVEVRLSGARDPKLARVETLPPLRGFRRVYAAIELSGRSSLENLNFLDELRHAGNLTIRKNGKLRNLKGLQSLETILNRLELEKNSGLRTLQGIENLERAAYIELIGNRNLESISALKDVTVSDKGIDNRGVRVERNASLKNLDGLQGVTVLEQNLTIIGNKSLESLKGLENLQRVDGAFEIANNPNLPSCEVQNLKKRIETNGPVDIRNNDQSASCD